jgi:predicted GNAT family N-acyltransferase
MDVHVIPADWASDREVLQAIRGEVFIEEQGVPREIEWDGEDDHAHHFLAINEAGQRIGCARLLPDGRIGRMAVLALCRGQGIGRQLLDAAVEKAKELGFSRVTLHAQSAVVEFYRKAGFLPEGGEFLEAGIVHQAMALTLPIPFEAPEDVPSVSIRPADPPAETAEAEFQQFDGELESIRGLVAFLAAPSRTIRLYSQELDHALFDRADVTEALSAFVRHGPPARLQVLIHSSHAIVSRGHQLLELARRLDSKIEIRKVPDELATDRSSFVLADERGYFLMPDHREYQSMANAYDPVQTERLAERFDYLWDRSESDPDLRVLRL